MRRGKPFSFFGRTEGPFSVFHYIRVVKPPESARFGNTNLADPSKLDDLIRTAAENTGNVPWRKQFFLWCHLPFTHFLQFVLAWTDRLCNYDPPTAH